MTPVSPVMPGSAEIEKVLGANQPCYAPLPVVYLDMECRPMVSRWRLSGEERTAIANGADIVMQQLTFKNPFQPVNLQVVMPDENPVLVEEVNVNPRCVSCSKPADGICEACEAPICYDCDSKEFHDVLMCKSKPACVSRIAAKDREGN